MFPGASTAREDADYAIVGAPLDVSTTFQPGARFGPDRIRRFAETFDDYDRRTDRHFSDLSVHDHGDVRAWTDAAEYVEHLSGVVRDVVWDDAVPLLLGGEHTVSAAGVDATDPDLFVCLDAHLDLREEYDGDEWSHACVTRRALETAEEAIVVGARTGSEEEWDRAAAEDVTVVPPEEVGAWLRAVKEGERDPFAGRDVYLSVDVDGADPAFAPGTGTMEPFGLTPREMRGVVRAAAPHCVGFDVVEVNDRDDGQAAALGGKLLREFVATHAHGTDGTV
ncbi:agmatinase [Halalkalicoccus sp. NIPERK01]|uniref:agmatinase n=1 Tax=Halalkalicoccus sp. NIPERK01 TaxID=3053469 RepID=UPI00256F2B03|nr:agmatinase [Halalkalicoccus sp. NIPERK01]MDL5362613.1 agmatinase [Halalkalicoccus sp. NIPERK01]